MGRHKTRGEPTMITQLKEAIAASGKTLVELSQTTDVSPSQISRFLRGERDLTFASAARVCEGWACSLWDHRAARPHRPRQNGRSAAARRSDLPILKRRCHANSECSTIAKERGPKRSRQSPV